MTRPLIFLDVDGPLIPFRARPDEAVADEAGNPLLTRLNPADGSRLLGLGCPLIWATTWMSDANEVVAPRLGLPRLPLVDWPDTDDDPPPGVHWKTQPLIAHAAGRPFIWLDDELTAADRHWAATHHSGRALLHPVDPFAGLTDDDFALIRSWLVGC